MDFGTNRYFDGFTLSFRDKYTIRGEDAVLRMLQCPRHRALRNLNEWASSKRLSKMLIDMPDEMQRATSNVNPSEYKHDSSYEDCAFLY